jgi:hypothetical protein
LRLGSNEFVDVSIPLLWGTRAIVQDRGGALSVIELGGQEARLEVLADKPAKGVEFVPDLDGFVVQADGARAYRFNPSSHTLTDLGDALPEVQISPGGTRIGTNFVGGSSVHGFGVGIAVTDSGIAIGAPLPSGLAELVV